VGGSARTRPETENTISKYKTIKVCLLYTVIISKSKCLLFLLPRERRSISGNALRRGSLLAMLLKTKLKAEAYRRHMQAKSNAAKQAASNSVAAPTNQQPKDSANKDDIGVINSDRCKRCEPLIGEEVCGVNGKTYVSLCHAVNCAGLRESDITASRCVEEVN
jgi:hypothetical protein